MKLEHMIARSRRVVVGAIAGLGLAAAGKAHADPPLAVQVAGAPELAAGVATAVGDELAQPVELRAADAACAAPCVAIVIIPAGRTARVEVRTADAPPHARVLDLPDDPLDWAGAIALLVGNLARDEAAALLAALAPPPAVEVAAAPPSPPPAVVAVAPQARRHRWGALGLVPYASTDGTAVGTIHHTASLDLVLGVAGGSSAVTLAGVADIERGPVDGLQLAGALATAPSVRGVQLAGAVAIADGARGVQLAGAVVVADQLRGLQLAGGVAIAAHVRGVQLAPVTIAGRNDGVQVGVINVARHGDTGVAIGLINIVPDGHTTADATIAVDGTTALMLRHGSRRWHNVYGVGLHRDGGWPGAGELTTDDVWMYGLGMGSSMARGPYHLDVEAMAWNVQRGAHVSGEPGLLGQLRFTLARAVGPVAVVGGATIDAYVTDDAVARGVGWSLGSDFAHGSGDRTRVRLWPSAFVGVRL